MDKEFCIDYNSHDGMYTIKTKTGNEITAKDISTYGSEDYTSALKDLGYKEVFYIPYYEGCIEECTNSVVSAEKHLEFCKESLKKAQENLDKVKNNPCEDWWYDCWTKSGY